MAGKKLEVGISADVSDFKKKISEVEFDLKELSKLKIERIKLGLDTSEINRNITDVKKTLRDLKSTTTDAGNSFGNFNKKTADGGAALTSFSRIAQDAPYGIIGVGNNITNTAEQFGALVKQTGSAGGALKALLSSLSGVGGVLLGVSLLTTGLTLLSQSGLTVSDVLDMLTGKYDKLGAEMAKASQEAAKQSGSEIANMKALVSVAQDETKSRQDRLIAVKELQKEFPAYFGNLSQEQILNGNVTGTVKELTQAIIERARASAFSAEIGKLASEEFDLTQKLIKAKEALRKEEEYRKKINQNTTSGNVVGGTASASSFLILNDLKNDVADIGKLLDENKKKQDAYTKAIEASTSASIKLKETAGGGKSVKTFNTPQVSKANAGITGGGLIDLTQLEFAAGKVDELGNKLKELPGTISTAFGGVKNAVELSAPGILEALINFNEQASLIINNAIADTFAGIGEALGNAFSTGANVLESVGATLLSALGSVLVSLGKLAIQTGVGILAVKSALKTLNPALAIGAGVALVAIGSAFSNGAKNIGSGGSGSGGSFSTRGGSNSSFSSSSGGFSSGGLSGNVVFEISGQKLIGVLNNTLNGNKRLGGAVGLG